MLINRTTIPAHDGLKIQRLSANFEGYSYRVELIFPDHVATELVEHALWSDLTRGITEHLRKLAGAQQKET